MAWKLPLGQLKEPAASCSSEFYRCRFTDDMVDVLSSSERLTHMMYWNFGRIVVLRGALFAFFEIFLPFCYGVLA